MSEPKFNKIQMGNLVFYVADEPLKKYKEYGYTFDDRQTKHRLMMLSEYVIDIIDNKIIKSRVTTIEELIDNATGIKNV